MASREPCYAVGKEEQQLMLPRPHLRVSCIMGQACYCWLQPHCGRTLQQHWEGLIEGRGSNGGMGENVVEGFGQSRRSMADIKTGPREDERDKPGRQIQRRMKWISIKERERKRDRYEEWHTKGRWRKERKSWSGKSHMGRRCGRNLRKWVGQSSRSRWQEP